MRTSPCRYGDIPDDVFPDGIPLPQVMMMMTILMTRVIRAWLSIRM